MQAKFLLKREQNSSLACGRHNYPEYEVHFHSHIELYIVLSGKMEALVNNSSRVLTAGDISVALSYDTHGYHTIEKADAIYIIIPRSYCSDILHFFEGKRMSYPFISDPATFAIVSDAAEKLRVESNELAKRGYLYVILGEILKHMSNEPQSEAQASQFSAEILIYISNHFRDELTLPSLAAEFGYNSSYLSRSFKQTFGISFGKYLTMLRLREAILLLKSENRSVTEAALECGFGSMRSFYRAFHDEFGCTPKEYLSKH